MAEIQSDGNIMPEFRIGVIDVIDFIAEKISPIKGVERCLSNHLRDRADTGAEAMLAGELYDIPHNVELGEN